LELWLQIAVDGDPDGMLPCDHGHDYFPRSVEEQEKMDAYWSSYLGSNNTIRITHDEL